MDRNIFVASQHAKGPVRYEPVTGPLNLGGKCEDQVRTAPTFLG
jgi:hypothetical protein